MPKDIKRPISNNKRKYPFKLKISQNGMKRLRLPNPLRWHMNGYSKAGLGTSLFLEEPNVMIDAGVRPTKFYSQFVPKTVLITHEHGDHCKFAKHVAKSIDNSDGNLNGSPIPSADRTFSHGHIPNGGGARLDLGIVIDH